MVTTVGTAKRFLTIKISLPLWVGMVMVIAIVAIGVVILYTIGGLAGGDSSATSQPTLSPAHEEVPIDKPQSNFSSTVKIEVPQLPELNEVRKTEDGYLTAGSLKTQLTEFSKGGIEEREDTVPFTPVPQTSSLNDVQEDIARRLTLLFGSAVVHFQPDKGGKLPNSLEYKAALFHIIRNPGLLDLLGNEIVPSIVKICPFTEEKGNIGVTDPNQVEYNFQGNTGLFRVADGTVMCGSRTSGIVARASLSAILIYGSFAGEEPNYYLVNLEVGEFEEF